MEYLQKSYPVYSRSLLPKNISELGFFLGAGEVGGGVRGGFTQSKS